MTGIAVSAAMLCMLLREQNKAMGMGLSIAAAAMLLGIALSLLRPILGTIDHLSSLAMLEDGLFAPLLKAVGIGFLCQIAGSICHDAGETVMEKIVELGGSVMAIYVSIPLLSTVLDLLEQLLGG